MKTKWIFLSVSLLFAAAEGAQAQFGYAANADGSTATITNYTGTPYISVVVEACTDLSAPGWTPLQTLVLTNGSFHFSEPYQPATLARYYRLTAP